MKGIQPRIDLILTRFDRPGKDAGPKRTSRLRCTTMKVSKFTQFFVLSVLFVLCDHDPDGTVDDERVFPYECW